MVPATSGALTFRLRIRRPGHPRPAHRGRERDRQVLAGLAGAGRPRAPPSRIGRPLEPAGRSPTRCRSASSRRQLGVHGARPARGRGTARRGPRRAGQHARDALEDAVAGACHRDPWLRDHPVEVEWWGGQFASGRLPPESDLVDRVRPPTTASRDRPPDVYGAPYGSDLRLLTGLAGIPTLQYGPGDARLAHGPDEAVPLADVVTAARTSPSWRSTSAGPTERPKQQRPRVVVGPAAGTCDAKLG